jgi:hypothetical protein
VKLWNFRGLAGFFHFSPVPNFMVRFFDCADLLKMCRQLHIGAGVSLFLLCAWAGLFSASRGMRRAVLSPVPKGGHPRRGQEMPPGTCRLSRFFTADKNWH